MPKYNRRMSSEDILKATPPPADHRLSYGSEANQFGELRLPKSKSIHPVVMNIHGGYWRARYGLEHAGHLCGDLAGAGFATWNVEYRRVGNAGGGWPGTMDDIKNGYRFLAQIAGRFNLDLKRIVVLGHSAGGHLALCLAAHESTVENVISLAGVVDLHRAWELHLSDDAVVELLGGTPSDVPHHYADADPMRLSIPRAHQRLIHGLSDDVVPPQFSRDYVERKRAAGENAELVELKGAGHFELIDPRTDAWKTVEKTIKQLLS